MPVMNHATAQDPDAKIAPPTITQLDNGQVQIQLSFGPTLVMQPMKDNAGFEVAIFRGGIEGTPLAGISLSFDAQIRPKLHKLGVDLDEGSGRRVRGVPVGRSHTGKGRDG